MKRLGAGQGDRKQGEGRTQAGRGGLRVFQSEEKATDPFCVHLYPCPISQTLHEKTQRRLLRILLLLGFSNQRNEAAPAVGCGSGGRIGAGHRAGVDLGPSRGQEKYGREHGQRVPLLLPACSRSAWAQGREGLHAAWRQGWDSVNLLLQGAFMEHRLCAGGTVAGPGGTSAQMHGFYHSPE